jgi:hypothetical protein
VVVAQCWDETWEWNGAWTLRTTTGPGRIDNARMEYDWLRQRCVLIGGYRYDITLGRYVLNGGTWEWNGNQWTLASSAYESARVAHATAYDGPRGRVVLYGGHNGGMGGIWIDHFDCQEWTGSGWVPRSAPPIPPGGANPSGGAHLAASLARGSLELFAAAAWELVRPSAATFRHFGAGCAGGSVQPALRLDAGQLAWLGGSLQLRGTGLGTLPMLAIGLSNSTWSGLPLPLPIPGASPCALLVSPDVAHILPVLGGNSITAMPVPNVAALAGLQVFAQVIAAAPSANAAGLLASAGVAVRAGIR